MMFGLIVTFFLFHFLQCQELDMGDCDHPHITLTNDVRIYDNIEGFQQAGVELFYNKLYNRTEFISVKIFNNMIRHNPMDCEIDSNTVAVLPSDEIGFIVPYQLGGSCNVTNLFPLNRSCYKGLWKDFEKLVVKRLDSLGNFKYCVKLVYTNEDDWRPSKIIARLFSYPIINHISSIVINNNSNSSKCEEFPNEILDKEMFA